MASASIARTRTPLDGGTIAWKLQREIILLLAWGPAILLQLAHPLVAQGVADHSTFRSSPRGRLRRFQGTLEAMLRLSFGTEAEARLVIARINAIHDHVNGQLSEVAGVFPAGTRYSAHDPSLLAWVHATLVDMNLRVYELFVDSPTLEEKNRYCDEASAIEERLGIPERRLPRTFAALRHYMDAMLAGGEIVVTDVARDLARDILYPPALLPVRPALWWTRLVTAGLLPPTIREGYGLSWDARKEAMLSRSASLIRALLPLTPSIVRHWPVARGARRAERRGACPFAPRRGDQVVNRDTTC
ncbi:MAG: hypothetical protein AUG14_05220 [Candidatus Rokubacteria bacterium 13_1_20CM_2_68_19]|nr:MAG: hypothetical protein AUG14_05220 [Candidatus Rokubacteria bacterium 13_1_20CM_2_68_19]PYN59705.1 MAG: DUF2236 domain-containing protein [Candidatus Rokubacteria bacterium]